MIEVDGVSRLYGDHPALDDVSLDIPAGQFVALMGHNGAGKSTLLRILAGLTRPSEGEVKLAGQSVRGTVSARGQLGLLAHESYLYGSLTPRENLEIYARLYAMDDAASRITASLEDVGMGWAADLPVEGFSRGMEQRVALARVLLHDPAVLLLDEPFAGLDRGAERFLMERLTATSRAGRTLVLVTHDPVRAARLAGRAVVLRRGRVVLDESLEGSAAESFPQRYIDMLEEDVR